MRSVHDSVQTVNAAATAIVAAEVRVQPSTVQKRRWGSCWSLYWCFGSYKHTKRIGHAVLFSAQVPVEHPTAANANAISLPFIAPPSSPASFLPSDPPSLASLSVHACSSAMTAPVFLIGPYAHETQLVSPPVFSTFTTEPSTASFTPPPEPSSPEVPFAQLLSPSLPLKRRNSGTIHKYPLSHYDFQPYQYPGSHIKSPVSTSGTSSPFTNLEAPKFIGYEHFMNYKWGSRVGSGSITPNGLGSGALTPNGGLSRLGSGTLTPNAAEPPSNDVVHHRVSFELITEDIPTSTLNSTVLLPKFVAATIKDKDLVTEDAHSFPTQPTVKTVPGLDSEEWHRTISLDSTKDFNFNNSEGSDKSGINCEWWTNDNVVSKELGPKKNWTFFPMLQSGVS